MKIDGSGSIGNPIQGTREGGKAQHSAHGSQTAVSRTESGDMTSITDTAARLQRLEQSIAAQPVVNPQRVEQVQQIVSDGGPKVDPAQLASKILTFENALNSARRGV